MPSNDLTADFRQIIREKERRTPDEKHRKLALKPTYGESGSGSQAHTGKEYMAEAYVILNHVNTLSRMLENVRKPYLNVETRNTPVGREGHRNIDINNGDPFWTGIRYLTSQERDQIDTQARVILTRCADRVKEMEALEKRRAELVANKTNPLSRLLPARLRQDVSTLASDFLAAHRAGVTWYLNRRLAEASQAQKEMQEERMKRQLERTRTLGSGAAKEMLHVGQKDLPSIPENTQTSSWLRDTSLNFTAATSGASSNNLNVQSNDIPLASDDEDEGIELSASQILQFETENANILRTVQDTLESVQQAESRLMDISALQMELVTHLTRQTELTDQLYEDAIATTSIVEKGNAQLKEAKRRAKDSRLFILLFLTGATLSLLFLHYY